MLKNQEFTVTTNDCEMVVKADYMLSVEKFHKKIGLIKIIIRLLLSIIINGVNVQ